ncbi:conjugal transfer protein [Actinomadura rayongensis]|uniref:Conjugal transfer protein n=1 Tax=Actinomadura rayongensis TaxID=1429076 RepID=A0A6I4W0G7_9ACTN|nr:conjugal transfer protein [Actinomadura rayongensis]MXQ62921.1 conjugal transfer protein [Actinomadura rayongensis]
MMARRSAVRDGRRTAEADEPRTDGFDPSDGAFDPPEPRRGRNRGGRWGGSGGRWWVWLGRAVLWALIIVILVNGVRAPFERFTSSDKPSAGRAAAPGKGTDFPASAAGAFALQFAGVYLNYDQKAGPAREAQLRGFLPDGSDGQFGWNGIGKLQVQSVQVAGVDARDDHNGTVTLLARSQDKWFRLAVPVYAASADAMVVSGRPALLPPPGRATLPTTGVRDRDTALEDELTPVLAKFFPAYAQSDQASLSRFAAGPALTGLNGSVTFVQVRGVIAPKGQPGERVVTATVAWQVPATGGGAGGGELEQDYRLDMIKKSGNWYVRDVRGVTEPSAP